MENIKIHESLNLLEEFDNRTIWRNLFFVDISGNTSFWKEEVSIFVNDLKIRLNELKQQPISWDVTYYGFKEIYIALKYVENIFQHYKNMYGIEEVNPINNDINELQKIPTNLLLEIENDQEWIKKFKNLKHLNISKERKNIVSFWLKEVFKTNFTEEQKIEHQKFSEQLKDKIKQFTKNQELALWKEHSALFVSQKNAAILDGLGDSFLLDGQTNASMKNKKGHIFYLDESTVNFILSFAKNRKIRQKTYEKYVKLNSDKRVSLNNDDVLRQILSLKQKMAKSLGFNNYADLVLSNFNLSTTKEAEYYLNNIEHQLKDISDQAIREIKEEALKDGIEQVKPWDMLYFYEKIKQQTKFKKQVKPFQNYFEFDSVISKLFKFLSKQLNIEITETKIDGKDDTLRVYELRDAMSPRHGVLTIVPFEDGLKDAYPFQTTQLDCDELSNGYYTPCMQLVKFNLHRQGKKTYLDFYDLYVVLHEIGHAIHAFFGFYKDGLLNSKKTSWDLIELPSQFLNHLLYDYDFMSYLSSYKKTKEKITEQQLQDIIEEFQFFEGFNISREIKKHKINLNLHKNFKPYSKLNPHEIVDKQLYTEGIIYNIARDSYMAENEHKQDYAPAGYIYLYADVLAFQLFEFYKNNNGFFQPLILRKMYEELFNTNNTTEIQQHIEKFIDKKSVNMMKYLRKTWNINIYGTTTWKDKEKNLARILLS